METLNINFEELINRLEGNEMEFVCSINNKIANPKNASLEKRDSDASLKWEYRVRGTDIKNEIVLKKIDDYNTALVYNQDTLALQILASVIFTLMAIYKGWGWINFLYLAVGIWILLPLIIQLKVNYWRKKYASRLRKLLDIENKS